LKRVVDGLSWCDAGVGKINQNRICAIMSIDNRNRFVITHDEFNTVYHSPLNETIHYALYHKKYYFLIGEEVETGKNDLWVSSDKGQKFNNAMLPIGLTVPYFNPSQILDDRDAIWIGVNHGSSIGWKLIQEMFILVTQKDINSLLHSNTF